MSPSRSRFPAGTRSIALALLAAAGCGGHRDRDDGDQTAPAPGTPAPRDPAATAPTAEPPAAALVDLAIPGKESDALDAAGAVPAWDAVIDRTRWLARRGDRGAVWGRMGAAVDPAASPATDPERWFVDERGAGSLAIRVALPATIALDDGDRAVLYGAWAVDAEQRWFWQVSGAARLPGRPDGDPDPLAASRPGHHIEAIRAADGAGPVSAVGPDGGVIWFEVVRGPRRPGDGWAIADRTRFAAVAVLLLPGEAEPYGGQDYMTPDERWDLDRNVRYLVRVGRWRAARKPDELPQMRALTPPKRLDPKAPR